MSISVATTPRTPTTPTVQRLNYIGSKYQLLGWLTDFMKEKTGFTTFRNKTVADLFAGTGVVSHHFRLQGAVVYTNDAELYSAVIAHAFTRSFYTERVKQVIAEINAALATTTAATAATAATAPPGFVTRHYSPYDGNERMFFTTENARRIDTARVMLETAAASAASAALTRDEYQFILASIIISADAVSNVPAVYGCYLKKFKSKALKPFILTPIHTIPESSTAASAASAAFHTDVIATPEFLSSILPPVDIAYLDPPYNERQYSKNYFPLNIIAKTPTELAAAAAAAAATQLKGKTGIPVDCFLSAFCRKGSTAETAFDTLIRNLRAKWVFLSYSSESIVSKEKMMEILSRYGTVSVIEREYKRFKSFEYNEDKAVNEYLFCLEKKWMAAPPTVVPAPATQL
jgi:adenine-specific DNA-methyltransferase